MKAAPRILFACLAILSACWLADIHQRATNIMQFNTAWNAGIIQKGFQCADKWPEDPRPCN